MQTFVRQSGIMGGNVRLSRVLRVEVCPSGLRFGILKLFGPFCRDFFVPWGHIRTEPRRLLLTKALELRFGGQPFPTLVIPMKLAERIASAAPGQLRLPGDVAASRRRWRQS